MSEECGQINLTKTISQEKNHIITPDSPLIITTNPNLLQIFKKFEGLLLIHRKPAIKPNNIQIIYSRSPNLKDMLVKSKVYTQSQTKLSQPCWQPRCPTCPHMNTSHMISNKSNHSYPIRGNFHCKSGNVIYVMTHNICHIQYVGETSNTMNNRFRVHESSIRTCNITL